ncbi:ACP7 [Branchiostoma lanceolatum]|uniref:ACP7 protein n=1 Tax=Branchiostoma lanceolatum TaxID=7740 RepID=A0A8J9ZG17_BRALA|nr:ACP7 [Branchiostoma lanceolatum]
MKNPEVVFLVVVLCGHAALQPLWGAAGETRRLTDFLEHSGRDKESSGQVFMSQVGSGEHLEERVRANQRGSVPRGSLPAQVHPGGVKGLHLSLAGAGQVRAMWMNPVPFTTPSDFKPQCVYTVLVESRVTSVEKQSANRQDGAPLIRSHDRSELTWLNTKPDNGILSKVLTNAKTAPSVAVGRAYTYTAGNFKATLNEAVMKYEGSVPVTINYRCGDGNYVMSPPFNFTVQSTTAQRRSNTKELQKKHLINSFRNFSPEASSTVSPGRTCAGEACVTGGERVGKVALIADMGIEEDSFTVRSIQRQVDQGELDFVLHAGDVSYADNFETTFGSGGGNINNSWVWVQYMTSLQGVAARVPYMTAPGNHEEQFDFAAYRNWLHMPGNESGSSSPYYYSFDYLGVHFVGISTEHDLRGNSSQHRWLEQDLRTADLNRAQVPWILVFGHRPLYCSSAIFWTIRCTKEAREYRSEIEELFQRYHVDVYVCGHNHQYERSWPVSDGNVTAKNYNNPAATVYIVTGAAGNPEGNDPTYVPGFMVPWRANYSWTVKTGWTLMEVNSSALAFSYIHSADSSRVVDSFTITKTS